MDADRSHRLRRSARAHRAAAKAVRRTWLDTRARVRGGDRGLQPVARPGIDPARDLLRAAAGGPGRCARRWPVLHRPGGLAHHGALSAVPRSRATDLDPWRGCWSGRSGGRRRRAGRDRPAGAELEARELADQPGTVDRIRRAGRRRRCAARAVPGAGAARLRDRGLGCWAALRALRRLRRCVR
jgi:hypothetical protein